MNEPSMSSGRSAATALCQFVLSSSDVFHRANPWFDNLKLAAYRNVADLIAPPTVLNIFTQAALCEIDRWEPPPRFVLKGNSGHSARLVWAFERCGPDTWVDRLHGSERDTDGIRALARGAAADTRGHCVFVEELLTRNGEIAPDYKFYMSGGRCAMLLVTARSEEGLKARFFDGDLRPIALAALFNAPDAVELEVPELADKSAIRKAITVSELLAARHRSSFCRYDFLLGDAGFAFGEISPVCGALMYWEPTEFTASLLISEQSGTADPAVRDDFRSGMRAQARAWIEANCRVPLTTNGAYRQFLNATDAAADDLTLEDFRKIARKAGATWDGP